MSLGPTRKHEKSALLMVRSAHPTLAGTETTPTNSKLETKNFSEQSFMSLGHTRKS